MPSESQVVFTGISFLLLSYSFIQKTRLGVKLVEIHTYLPKMGGYWPPPPPKKKKKKKKKKKDLSLCLIDTQTPSHPEPISPVEGDGS